MLAKVAIFIIRLVSTFFRTSGLRACRYYPSCSRYSVEAFEKLGFFKALWVSAKRVLSCHPFSPGGFHPLDKHNCHCEERSDEAIYAAEIASLRSQ